jgi:hypothetical protein
VPYRRPHCDVVATFLRFWQAYDAGNGEELKKVVLRPVFTHLDRNVSRVVRRGGDAGTPSTTARCAGRHHCSEAASARPP